MNKKIKTIAAIACGLAACSVSQIASANLVANGDFSLTSAAGNAGGQINYGTGGITLTSWSVPQNNYAFVFGSGTADTTGENGQDGNVKLWGPGTGSANGMPASSPNGGNYLGVDPSYQNGGPLTQMISGLIKGDTYTLSFDWAGAQQYGSSYNAPTTEGWNVTLGSSLSQSVSTALNGTAAHGFSPWTAVSYTFTPTSSGSELLSFLATGGPSASEPPFALLDGVSITQNTVPDATSTAGLFGLVVAAGVAARRRFFRS